MKLFPNYFINVDNYTDNIIFECFRKNEKSSIYFGHFATELYIISGPTFDDIEFFNLQEIEC